MEQVKGGPMTLSLHGCSGLLPSSSCIASCGGGGGGSSSGTGGPWAAGGTNSVFGAPVDAPDSLLGLSAVVLDGNPLLLAVAFARAKTGWQLARLGRILSVVLAALWMTLATVDALAAVELGGYGFVEAGGRPGHEGYFPVSGPPVQGSTAVLRVLLHGPVREAQVRFVSAIGTTLTSAPLQQVPGSSLASPARYGKLLVPSEPYFVAIAGTDSVGAPFEFDNYSSAPAQPTPIGVAIRPTLGQIIPNGPVVLYVEIQNTGPTDTFAVTVTDNAGNVAAPSTSSITIGTKAIATLKLSFKAPVSFSVLAGYELTVTVRGTVYGSANHAQVKLPVDSSPGSDLLVDIKPGSCLNLVPANGRGLTAVAVLSTNTFSASSLDTDTIHLAGLRPRRVFFAGRGAKWHGPCGPELRDPARDLWLLFDTSELASTADSLLADSRKHFERISLPLTARSTTGLHYIGYGDLVLVRRRPER